MYYLKNLLIGLATSVAAYLNPISGDIKSLLLCLQLTSYSAYWLGCWFITKVLALKRRSGAFLKRWRSL
ncbi:hypothetical protein [Bacteroides stercorirosoris]|uniref:hypothetical protein n=1 Tax=Bacteroides stercorirosoris TaxID=871324 RepID=UPI001FB077BF|nr:hypothetical protein [Bacteroides stercorirosoris]